MNHHPAPLASSATVHPKRGWMLSAALFSAIAATTLAAPSAAYAQSGQRVAGAIIAVSDTALEIKPDSSETVKVTLAPGFTVARLDKATTADLKPGIFVGVGARPQPDGAQKAVQIVIFPESMRGTGEGHRAWGVMPEATMTNGAIADTVQAVDGPNFTLSYKGGTQKVVTPADASILALKLATPGDVKVGARGQVIAAKQPDGSLRATRITIWGDGVSPY